MDHQNNENTDPLIEGFESVPAEAFNLPKAREGLKDSIFSQTCQVVRARAIRRRFMILGVVAAAYIVGVTTTFLWKETFDLMDGDSQVSKRSVDDEIKDGSSPIYIEPSELVSRSEQASTTEQFRLLKQAGDLYLSEKCEIERALNCYSKALDSLPQSMQMEVNPDDSWLLAALKDGRR